MGDTDVIHPKGSEVDWNEGFHFSFYDRHNDICGFMRVGLIPNRMRKSMFCFLMMPDGTIMGVRGGTPFKNTELSARGLVFQRIVPEKRWKLMFNGAMCAMYEEGQPVKRSSFMLDWEGLNKLFDYRGCVSWVAGEEGSDREHSEHLEQFGRITGLLEIGGEEYVIDGLGERYHSWGAGYRAYPRMWMWITCQFSDGGAFNVTRLRVGRKDFDAGFIHLDGRNLPLVNVEINTVYGNASSPESFDMIIEDEEGDSHHVSAKVIKKAMIELPAPNGQGISLMHEALIEYRMGNSIGYGVAEYLIRERSGPIQIISEP